MDATTPAEMFNFSEAITQGTIKSDGTDVTATAYVENNGLQAGDYTISGTDVLNSTGAKIGTYDSATGAVKDLSSNDLVNFATDTSVTEFTVGGIDISTQATADKAITTIQESVEKVSEERSKLGAYQNRLEHTINNLGTSAENLSAAESRIRDVDMAAEMMEFTKMNILQQAATAMLAQANMQPQMVLQLLGR